MACSFCFAPLLAARSRAQPPQGADMIRTSQAQVWPADPDRLRRISKSRNVSPIALGGHRPGGCQVWENPRQLRINAMAGLRLQGHGNTTPWPLFWTLTVASDL